MMFQLVVSQLVFDALQKGCDQTDISPMLGIPVILSKTLPPGWWIEVFKSKKIIHRADGTSFEVQDVKPKESPMFNFMKGTAIVLIAMMMLTACTQNELQVIATVIPAVEAALPLVITIKDPDTRKKFSAYVAGAATVAFDLVSNPSIAGASQASADFKKNILPTITADVSPDTAVALQNIADAVQTFIDKYPPATAPTNALARSSPIKLSAADKATQADYKLRLAKVVTRLAPPK